MQETKCSTYSTDCRSLPSILNEIERAREAPRPCASSSDEPADAAAGQRSGLRRSSHGPHHSALPRPIPLALRPRVALEHGDRQRGRLRARQSLPSQHWHAEPGRQCWHCWRPNTDPVRQPDGTSSAAPHVPGSTRRHHASAVRCQGLLLRKPSLQRLVPVVLSRTPYRQFGPLQFHNDNDYILAVAETDPLVTWYQQGWWGSGPKGDCEAPSLSNCNCHCDVLSHAAPFPRQLHIPSDFLTTQGDGCSGNNGLSMLQPDNVTVIQTQPAYRCKKGGPLLSQSNGTIGCPQPHPLTVDITSSGPETALGAHGGSGLSAIGGTIRLHEIGPDAPPIAHVLKLELFAHQVREDCIENS